MAGLALALGLPGWPYPTRLLTPAAALLTWLTIQDTAWLWRGYRWHAPRSKAGHQISGNDTRLCTAAARRPTLQRPVVAEKLLDIDINMPSILLSVTSMATEVMVVV